MSLKIKKLFTSGKAAPYTDNDFTQMRVFVGGSEKNIFVPKSWSQNAVDILSQKYLRRAGVAKFLKKIPENGVPEWLWRSEPENVEHQEYVGEDDARQIFHRLAGTWTYWAWKGEYITDEEDAKNFYHELSYMLFAQIGAPNSPQFFNTGIHWAYGISGIGQGHYYYEDGMIKESRSSYERPQVHACFIQSIEDNLVEENGIIDFVMRESRIFKFGSGSGANFSALRGSGERLSSGGQSSGLMSFLKVGDSAAGAIKSGGTTRRAAKMVSLDEDHPEIEQFVNWKVKEEDKVIALTVGSKIVGEMISKVNKACQLAKYSVEKRTSILDNMELAEALQEGYQRGVPVQYISRIVQMLNQGISEFKWKTYDGTNFNDEAYSTVAGQNSNNSVRVSNYFMNQMLKDGSFELTNRVDGSTNQKIRARSLWDEICVSAWICGDPGLQFDTTINEWHTCPNSGRIRGSNPCSEYNFLDNTACNLASINLLKFLRDTNEFDSGPFLHAVHLWMVVLEISVYMAQYPSKEIARLSYMFRTTGLGYANLGGLLMSMGVPYDSPKGRAIAGYITALLHGKSYETSAHMANLFGAFEGYEKNREPMLTVIKNHRNAALGVKCDLETQPVFLDRSLLSKQQLEEVDLLWKSVCDLGEKHGFRNAQVTVIAPTGTIGMLMDCDTTGCEPDYALVKIKKLVKTNDSDPDYMKIVNNCLLKALKVLGYSEKQIQDIVQYVVGSGSIENAPYINHQSLKKLGFNDEDLQKLNSAMKYSHSLSSAFAEHVLGSDTYNRLGVARGKDQKDFNLLTFLGFSKEEIDAASIYVCGHLCIEGAPHLKEEHLPVFDCSTKNGAMGKRYITPEGHVKMMAAIQSFVSGAISKTVNLPADATIADCSEAYLTAWKLGVKAIALFREGSRLSNPLMGAGADAFGMLKSLLKSPKKQEGLPRGVREKLPDVRKGYTQRITIDDWSFYYTVGENDSGDVREVFITGGGREGAPFRSVMNCFAKAISIAMQYGAPIEDIVHSFAFVKFPPSGRIKGDKDIMSIESFVDYVVRSIGIRYRNMNYLANSHNYDAGEEEVGQSQTQTMPNPTKTKENKSGDHRRDRSEEQASTHSNFSGYTGEFCSHCNGCRMIRNGACSYCLDCNTSGGCS